MRVVGPNGELVDVKFFVDGSVRFRLNNGGPMAIRYAFLPGVGQNVIIELTPMSNSPWKRIKEE
jgi:hypothetical protein